jgi:hypothetical protein
MNGSRRAWTIVVVLALVHYPDEVGSRFAIHLVFPLAAVRASDALELPAGGNETAEARVSSSGERP